MKVARAFANMLRAAGQDPLWALTAAATAPFLAFWSALGGVVLVLARWLRGCWPVRLADAAGFSLARRRELGVLVLMVAPAWRLLTAPLLVHFAALEEDAHGSARFAHRNDRFDPEQTYPYC